MFTSKFAPKAQGTRHQHSTYEGQYSVWQHSPCGLAVNQDVTEHAPAPPWVMKGVVMKIGRPRIYKTNALRQKSYRLRLAERQFQKASAALRRARLK